MKQIIKERTLMDNNLRNALRFKADLIKTYLIGHNEKTKIETASIIDYYDRISLTYKTNRYEIVIILKEEKDLHRNYSELITSNNIQLEEFVNPNSTLNRIINTKCLKNNKLYQHGKSLQLRGVTYTYDIILGDKLIVHFSPDLEGYGYTQQYLFYELDLKKVPDDLEEIIEKRHSLFKKMNNIAKEELNNLRKTLINNLQNKIKTII